MEHVGLGIESVMEPTVGRVIEHVVEVEGVEEEQVFFLDSDDPSYEPSKIGERVGEDSLTDVEDEDGFPNVVIIVNEESNSDDDNPRSRVDPQRDFGGIPFHVEPGKEIDFAVGQYFDDHHHFKRILQDYMIKGGYKIKYVKNDKERITARCSERCPWRIHASRILDQQTFFVKTINDEHTCQRICNEKAATAKWIAEKLGDLLKANPNLDNDTMRAALTPWGIEPKSWKLANARKIARTQIQGTFKESHTKLQKYCWLLSMKNEGSLVKIQARTRSNLDAPPTFWRVFVCLHAMKEGFITGCRPFLGLDGCHLKGPYGGILLAAVALDANSGLFPIAWAVVDQENSENWQWFLDLLFDTIARDERYKLLTIMTDGQKGLGRQIESIFPNGYHRRCAKHMVANFKQLFPGSALTNLFWEAAYATTRAKHKFALAKMRLLNTGKKMVDGVEMGPADWLDRIPASKWSRSAFDHDAKSPDLTNNLCESFNSWILKVRGLPIVEFLDQIRQKIMIKLQKSHQEAVECNDRVCPVVMKKLNLLTKNCRSLKIFAARNREFEIMDLDNCKFEVNLNTRTCSCNMWGLSGIPCIHAVACLMYNGDDLQLYVDEFYTVDMWKKANEGIVHPFADEDLEPENENERFEPPEFKRRAGRPKKARRRQEGEAGPSTRAHTVKCSTCGVVGHNKRSCQGVPVRHRCKKITATTTSSRNQINRKRIRIPRQGLSGGTTINSQQVEAAVNHTIQSENQIEVGAIHSRQFHNQNQTQ